MERLKKELRQQLRAALDAVEPVQRQRLSNAACDRLLTLPEYQSAQAILLFLSMPAEVDTSPIALRAWTDGRRVLAPKISWEQKRMQPVEISSLTSGLAPDSMGIRQPIEGLPQPISEIDLVIVPGLAFDAEGNRLGRGRGFYDRFLSNPEFRGVACGLAFESQVVPRVPRDDHDRRVDLLVTDAAIRRFSGRSA